MIDRLVSEIPVESPQPVILFNDSAMSATPDAVSGPGIVYFIIVDNSQNSSIMYVELYDAVVGDVTVGQSAANFPASSSIAGRSVA